VADPGIDATGQNLKPRGKQGVPSIADRDVDPFLHRRGELGPRSSESPVDASRPPVLTALADLIGGEEEGRARSGKIVASLQLRILVRHSDDRVVDQILEMVVDRLPC
jgi:hypothetical protein